MNRRKRTLALLLFVVLFLSAIVLGGLLLQPRAEATDLAQKNLPPSGQHIFGTDALGRDMFARTLCGLSLSIRIGLLTALLSTLIAFFLGAAAATFKAADRLISWLIDLFMGVPHILLLILLSFAFGKGFYGVLLAITLSHWMSLSRIVRSEALQLRQSGYILVAEKLGHGKMTLVGRHMLPQLLPQLITGFVLLFPHAILHEASITFLGFGLSAEQPAIGIILSESMRYLTMGYWWLSVLPGLLLIITVVLFNLVGRSLSALQNPAGAHA